MNQKAIEAALSQRVLHQESATNQVASLLYRATRPRRSTEDVSIRIVTALLSGVSGTGKTLICEQTQPLMLTGPGQQYHKQYISWHLGAMDEVNLSMFSGCSAGWDGYGAVSLAQKLKEAYAPVGGEPPPYVVLHLEELNAATPKVMDALNSLLDRGVIDLTATMEQVRPDPRTTLVILFTGNYAADAIDPLDTLASVAAIKRAMRATLSDWHIGRISWVVPFRAFTREEMRDIFQAAYRRILTEHPISSVDVVVEFCLSALGQLITHVLGHYDKRLGVRGAMHLFRGELETFFDNSVAALEAMTPPVEQVRCEARHYQVWETALRSAADEHFFNRERYNSYVKRGGGNVDALVMVCEGGLLTTLILLPECLPSPPEVMDTGATRTLFTIVDRDGDIVIRENRPDKKRRLT
jgi:ATP-dependent Clp protease ATP-binding subunit ClpA